MKLPRICAGLVACLCLLVGRASAQGGQIQLLDLFSDPGGVSCTVSGAPGLVTLYVIHSGATMRGVRYRIDLCHSGLVYVSEQTSHASSGSALTGIDVDYGACQGTFIQVQTITLLSGNTTAGAPIYVLPYPGELELRGTTCAGADVFVNNSWACVDCSDCGGLIGPGPPCNQPVPIDESTWGAVKALYQ